MDKFEEYEEAGVREIGSLTRAPNANAPTFISGQRWQISPVPIDDDGVYRSQVLQGFGSTSIGCGKNRCPTLLPTFEMIRSKS